MCLKVANNNGVLGVIDVEKGKIVEPFRPATRQIEIIDDENFFLRTPVGAEPGFNMLMKHYQKIEDHFEIVYEYRTTYLVGEKIIKLTDDTVLLNPMGYKVVYDMKKRKEVTARFEEVKIAEEKDEKVIKYALSIPEQPKNNEEVLNYLYGMIDFRGKNLGDLIDDNGIIHRASNPEYQIDGCFSEKKLVAALESANLKFAGNQTSEEVEILKRKLTV